MSWVGLLAPSQPWPLLIMQLLRAPLAALFLLVLVAFLLLCPFLSSISSSWNPHR